VIWKADVDVHVTLIWNDAGDDARLNVTLNDCALIDVENVIATYVTDVFHHSVIVNACDVPDADQLFCLQPLTTP
jgi:hypothetical protein